MDKRADADILNIIRTEYISDPTMSYRKLSEKHKFPLKKISQIGKKENWGQLRVQLGDKILKKTMNRISTEKSDDLAKVIKSTNKLLKHIDRALESDEQFEEIFIVKDTGEKIKLGKTDARAINNMANALKNVFEILKVAESDNGDKSVEIKIAESKMNE